MNRACKMVRTMVNVADRAVDHDSRPHQPGSHDHTLTHDASIVPAGE